MAELRIPFLEAVAEKRMLKHHWDRLSYAQQAALLAAYGCPLPDVKDEKGWSHLDYFWASQGYGEFDELGYLTKVNAPGPYIPQEYRETWFVAGVRAGKSLLAATAIAYETICGGHEEWLNPGTRGYSFQVAQDLRLAQKALIDIKAVLDTIPFINAPYFGRGNYKGRMMDEPTANRINLWNGMTIMTMPPTVRAVRGYDSPSAVLDEIGVWPSDAEAANLDKEVYDQIQSRQATFEYPKIFGLSSPWVMSGMLYDRWRAGTEGSKLFCSDCENKPYIEREKNCAQCSRVRAGSQGILVLHLPTAALNNPQVKHSWLVSKAATNPTAFRRECLAEFLPAASAFLDPARVDSCKSPGVHHRSPIQRKDGVYVPFVPFYVAAMDPGFKRDTFGFGIGHMDESGTVVIDYTRAFKPTAGVPNEPGYVLDEISKVLKEYNIVTVLCDQYNFPSLNHMAQERGFMMEQTTFTGVSKNNIFGNLYTLINQGKIKLLDKPEELLELKALQRTVTQSNNIQIGAPPGMHDDMAVIIAMIAARAVYLSPQKIQERPNESYQDLINKQIEKRWKANQYYGY